MSKSSQYSSNEFPGYGENVFQSILDSRVRQMLAITIPSDEDQIKILKEIINIKSTPRKLTTFFDFLIGQITALTMENFQFKSDISRIQGQNLENIKDKDSQINSFNERINNIAEILGVKDNLIEKKLNSLMKNSNKPKEPSNTDYISSCQLLDAQEGHLCKEIEKMLAESDRIHRKLSQDRNLLVRQNEEIRRLQDLLDPDEKNEKSESSDTESETSDPELKKHTEKIDDLISIVNQITKQADRLSSLYSNPNECTSYHSHSKKKRQYL